MASTIANGKIVCADLTTDDAGDSTTLPDLLNQIDGPVAWLIADGAYDGAQPVICLQHALVWKQTSLSRPRRTPLPAPNRRRSHRLETAVSSR
ncbi:transposase [Pararhizobium sp. LjRoot238]|uniref:transposase n=1 Tax=Pararhizobium sp. LjRoot238 TaxID=3342293 RepID=UPI003F4FF1AD